jgi:hypothetical protein
MPKKNHRKKPGWSLNNRQTAFQEPDGEAAHNGENVQVLEDG